MPASRTGGRGSRMRSAAPALGIPSCWPAKGTNEASSSAVASSPGTNEPRPRRRSAVFRRRNGNEMSRAVEEVNRRMLRARDAMDRAYAEPLDLATLARVANVSEAHFIRTFRATFGETPHRYLQRRRVERAMFLLRATDRSVTDICLDVGFTSLGTFSRNFRAIVGEGPSDYRAGHGPILAPNCIWMAATRPVVAAGVAMRSSSFGEADAPAA